MSAFHSDLWRKACLCCISGVAAHACLSFCLVWLGSAGEVLQEKAATPTSPFRCLVSLGTLHSFSCSVLLCPCRVHQLDGETSIQLPSLEQRCTYLVAELIGLGHFTPTMRSTVTALKCSIQKQTPGWTPLQLQCFQKADGAIQLVSEGLLREKDIPACLRRGVWSAGWRCGVARGAQSLASVESCCPLKSLCA